MCFPKRSTVYKTCFETIIYSYSISIPALRLVVYLDVVAGFPRADVGTEKPNAQMQTMSYLILSE